MNDALAQHVLEVMKFWGVKECCIAPGARNAPFVFALTQCKEFKLYFWPEERSAAFFALGRIKATAAPVAVITTSGTAAAELLPATMEGYYSGLPLLLITADRPRRYRGSGAPQSAEQVGLFGCYTPFSQDLEADDRVCQQKWDLLAPAHLNVCFEEPKKQASAFQIDISSSSSHRQRSPQFNPSMVGERFRQFWMDSRFPFIIVSALPEKYRELAVECLCAIGAPVYLEATSGIREDDRLSALKITHVNHLYDFAASHGYSIDSILRIGGVPTLRFWRDLEDGEGKYQVFNLSDLPFSGLSWTKIEPVDLNAFFKWAISEQFSAPSDFFALKSADQCWQNRIQELFAEEPRAEPSMVHSLSKIIPVSSRVYLGNSLPIREWDLAATWEKKAFQVSGSRGVNGIDGQISTFLGYCSPSSSNWGIVGDLTALYDLVAPWISSQLLQTQANLVIINNGGGQIFSPIFGNEAFLNQHQLSFKSFASFWKWDYEYWEKVPCKNCLSEHNRLMELVPDNAATQRFNIKLGRI